MQSLDESVTSHKNRKKYSSDFKLKTIAAAEKEGNRAVAGRLKVNPGPCILDKAKNILAMPRATLLPYMLSLACKKSASFLNADDFIPDSYD
uniref:Transposase n=1 Tax=Romanomermis culicivorax TaxID=13658 RepID=A0A915KYG4_ROMCU